MSSCALLITNLHLLGFPDRAQLTSPHVFARGSVNANQRLFESIVHFLLTRLDPARARRSFRLCYPCIDKDSAREFRNAVYKWLEEIKSDVPGEFFIRRSLLDECRGERFEGVLLSLSNLVLVAEMNGEALRQHPAFVACTPKQAVSTLSTEQESCVKRSSSSSGSFTPMSSPPISQPSSSTLPTFITNTPSSAAMHHTYSVSKYPCSRISPVSGSNKLYKSTQYYGKSYWRLRESPGEPGRSLTALQLMHIKHLPLTDVPYYSDCLYWQPSNSCSEAVDAAQFCRSASHQLQEQQLYLRNLVELRGTIKAAEANARESVKYLRSQAQAQPLPVDLALPPAIAMPVFAVAATAEESITHPQRRTSFGMSLAHHKDTGELLQAMTINLVDAEDDSMLL
ncbi:hypothetical protein RI367_005890 [Sorochytrium milnesiophthora]